MTELREVRGDRVDALTEDVARRLRGTLAERRIKHKEVMDRTGWGKTTVYRKVNGLSPLDTSELDLLGRLFGISPMYLVSGVPDNWPTPGPGGSTAAPAPTADKSS